MNRNTTIFGISIFPEKESPVLQSWLGSISFSSYSVVLLVILMERSNWYTGGAHGWSWRLIFTLFLCTGVISIIGSSCIRSPADSVSMGLFFFDLYGIVLGIGLYSSWFSFNYDCHGCSFAPFLATAVSQAAMISIIAGIYSRSFLPANIKRLDTLEVHWTNWWRLTQVVLSLAIAMGVGLFAQFLIDSDNLNIIHLSPLIFGMGLGLLAIFGFVFTKMYYVEKKMGDRKTPSNSSKWN